MTGFDVYCLYIALTSHFTRESYDYFKYGGKSRANVNSFEARNDKFFFKKLASKYTSAQVQDVIIANILYGKTWVGDLLSGEAEEIYLEYSKRKQSFTYNFQEELSRLFKDAPTVKSVFQSGPGSYPIVLEKCLSGELSFEVFCVLNVFFDFFSTLDKKLGKDDYIWSKVKLKATKLHPFLEYDKDKLKKVVKDIIINIDSNN